MKNKKILVVITLLEHEAKLFETSLKTSLGNLSSVLEGSISFLFVLQTDNMISLFPEFESVILQIPISCLSRARNAGINYALENGFEYVLFHDSSIIFGAEFCNFVKMNIAASSLVLTGKLIWNLSSTNSNHNTYQASELPINLIRNHYVGSYVLPLSLINDTRFNENIGPGKLTKIKSGEDISFLVNVFSHSKIRNVLFHPAALIFHPPRPSDRSKQVTYARGQGALYRYLMTRKILIYGIGLHFCLFWINALASILLFKKKSLEVLSLRLIGFFSNDFKRFN